MDRQAIFFLAAMDLLLWGLTSTILPRKANKRFFVCSDSRFRYSALAHYLAGQYEITVICLRISGTKI